MCLNGTPLGSGKMQSTKLSQVIELKNMGSSDGDMSTEINKRTQCICNVKYIYCSSQNILREKSSYVT